MPRLRLDTFLEKERKAKWNKKAPETVYCPRCKGIMDKGILNTSFISGYGVIYECRNKNKCGYEHTAIVNEA